MKNILNHPVVDQLNDTTMGQALRRSASAYSDYSFFKTADDDVTFADFDQKVDQFSSALLNLGIERGDHVQSGWATRSNGPYPFFHAPELARLSSLLIHATPKVKLLTLSSNLTQKY